MRSPFDIPHIFIGSTAIKVRIPTFRTPRDVDVLATEKIECADTIIVPQYLLDIVPNTLGVATLDAIYTIKCSHLAWDIKWSKHKADVLYLKWFGCQLIEPLYKAFSDYWKETNGNKPYLSLYKKKDDFFNDHVTYVYDHDYLHELVAYPNKPIYTKCLKENETVAIDKEKFDKLSFDEQIRMFKEEITVIASERWLIPPKICGKYSWMEAYSLALHKTVTRLTKNWACDFIIQHLEYFVKPEKTMFQEILKLREGEKIMANVMTDSAMDTIIAEVITAYNEQNTDKRWGDTETDNKHEFVDLPSFGEFESLEQDGGGEGGTEHCEFIFKWKGEIYRLTYRYYSHHGYDFDYAEMATVKPVEKMVTVYE
jgi:hypothetical protein